MARLDSFTASLPLKSFSSFKKLAAAAYILTSLPMALGHEHGVSHIQEGETVSQEPIVSDHHHLSLNDSTAGRLPSRKTTRPLETPPRNTRNKKDRNAN